MTTHGHFHWNELNTRDAKKAMDFYGKTVGWTFDEMQMPGGGMYYIGMNGEAPAGGIFTMTSPDFDGVPEHWFSYLAVDDVDALIKTAVAEGGKVIQPVMDVPGVGRIAIVQDSNGANLGWMTPAT